MSSIVSNGRVNILGPNTADLFAMTDRIPLNSTKYSFRDALKGNWYDTPLSNAYFSKEKGSSERGVWDVKKGVPDKWFMPYKSEALDLNFKISLSSFKHVGIFPEQASNWEFLAKKNKKNLPRTL